MFKLLKRLLGIFPDNEKCFYLVKSRREGFLTRCRYHYNHKGPCSDGLYRPVN